MRMNEKISTSLSYAWNAIWGFFAGLFGVVGSISPQWWMVIISAIGTLGTMYINYHFKKKHLEKVVGDGQD